MGSLRVILTGDPYTGPRFYGEVSWNSRNVYLRHPNGAKDSRHSDGNTFLTSTGDSRTTQLRVPTSSISRELVNFIELGSQPFPSPLRGEIRPRDLVLDTASVGTAPRIAVEIVASTRAPGVAAAWGTLSTVSSAHTVVDKGLGQSLVIAVAGNATTPPSTHSR